MKKLGLLLFTIITLHFYSPAVNAMQGKKKITPSVRTKHAPPVLSKKTKVYPEPSKEEDRDLCFFILANEENDAINLITKLDLDPNYKLKSLHCSNKYIITTAVKNGLTKLLQKLINIGANVNIKTGPEGRTLLHEVGIYDVFHKNDEDKAILMAKILIKAGAKLEIMDDTGHTPTGILPEDSKLLTYLENFEESAPDQQYTTIKTTVDKGNVLDLCIFLEEDKELFLGKSIGIITNVLVNAINSQEAILTTLEPLRDLLEKSSMRNNDKDKYIKFLYFNNWSIFCENNQRFIILIPHSKYPKIEKVEDLEKIGLNPKFISKFIYYKENFSPEHLAKLKILLEKVVKKEQKIPDIIKSLFLEKRTVDVRVFLSGHGLGDFGAEIIAELTHEEYRALRNTLNNIGCSFLDVFSCFGGENVYMTQTLNLNLTTEGSYGTPLSSKNFIEAVIGIPGFSIPGWAKTFNKTIDLLFININNFLQKEKNEVIKLIKSKYGLNDKETKLFSKDLTEQQVLAGGKLKVSYQSGKTIYYDLPPLIKRKKEITESTMFLKIFQDFIPKYATNLPRVRFPGGTSMAPLGKVFPDLIQEAKNLLNNTLIQKNTDLLKLKKLLQQYEKKSNMQDRIPALKAEIKKDEFEIKDIKKYISQLG